MGPVGRPARLRAILICFALGMLFLAQGAPVGCENRRPPGYLSIGKSQEVAVKSGFLKDKQFYLHRDGGGIAIMSTLCSYDLSPLKIITDQGREILVSDYNQSQYDLWGNVLRGPATRPLPFYQATLDAGVYGGPVDTIYVQIGNEVSREWRLALP